MKLEGDTDELIFDYLEGNLDKEEREAFDLLKEENETFNHQVRLWQNAYVSEALPGTADLEARCLVNHRPGTSLLNKAGFLTSLVVLMLLIPSSRSEVTTKIDPPVFGTAQLPQAESPPARSTSKEIIIPAQATGKKIIKPEEVPAQQDQHVLSTILYEPVSDSPAPGLRIDVPVKTPAIVFRPIEVRLTKRAIPMFTDREIAKMKRRHQQRASKFEAGDVPYVVPLSSQNF